MHVNDLVDFVSEEAEPAGKSAAIYILNKKTKKEKEEYIYLKASNGIRYTVPSIVNIENIDKELTVRFRVGGVFTNKFLNVYFDGARLIHKKHLIFAPGEMETLKLNKDMLLKEGLKNIEFKIEDN